MLFLVREKTTWWIIRQIGQPGNHATFFVFHNEHRSAAIDQLFLLSKKLPSFVQIVFFRGKYVGRRFDYHFWQTELLGTIDTAVTGKSTPRNDTAVHV